MKYFYYIALIVLITAVAWYVKNKYDNDHTGINIREIMSIEVKQIYFAEGKTFVELNVINKTSYPIAFGDTDASKNNTRFIQSVTGYALTDKQTYWYHSQFPYWNIVCSVEGGSESKLYVVFDKDLKDKILSQFVCIFTHLEYRGKEYYQIFDFHLHLPLGSNMQASSEE